MRVVDIDSEDAFDKTIQSASGALVVVDYSTTWCGPCKVIAPKFDELSDKYPEAVFLKVRLADGPVDKTLLGP
jgi:thioredoxin 1